jgi:ankyrin repeat protein
VTRSPPLLSDEDRAKHEAAAIAEIERDPSLARTTTGSATPVLALAVSSGARDLARRLLAKGADPNAGGGGETPLCRAAARSDLVLVEALLDAGADPNQAGPGSAHPVIAARARGFTRLPRTVDRSRRPSPCSRGEAGPRAGGWPG